MDFSDLKAYIKAYENKIGSVKQMYNAVSAKSFSYEELREVTKKVDAIKDKNGDDYKQAKLELDALKGKLDKIHEAFNASKNGYSAVIEAGKKLPAVIFKTEHVIKKPRLEKETPP